MSAAVKNGTLYDHEHVFARHEYLCHLNLRKKIYVHEIHFETQKKADAFWEKTGEKWDAIQKLAPRVTFFNKGSRCTITSFPINIYQSLMDFLKSISCPEEKKVTFHPSVIERLK